VKRIWQKHKIIRICTIFAGIVGFVSAVIGIFVFVTGRNLPEIIPARTSNVTATNATTTSTSPSTKLPVAVGDIIPFGQWDWRVLAVENGKALLITQDVIELRSYHNEKVDVTWETCELRAYLNGAFYRI